jgi:hypothetical protein
VREDVEGILGHEGSAFGDFTSRIDAAVNILPRRVASAAKRGSWPPVGTPGCQLSSIALAVPPSYLPAAQRWLVYRTLQHPSYRPLLSLPA